MLTRVAATGIREPQPHSEVVAGAQAMNAAPEQRNAPLADMLQYDMSNWGSFSDAWLPMELTDLDWLQPPREHAISYFQQ